MREEKNWTQDQMANHLSMSSGGYAKIERGETRLNVPRLEQIAEIFEVDICELMQNQDGVVYQFNQEGDNHHQNVVYSSSKHKLQSEIDRLNLIIQHKDEVIKQKDIENQLLKELVTVLKSQLE